MGSAEGSFAVCEGCDEVHRWTPLLPRETARCHRCGTVLGRGHRLDLVAVLALTLAALIVFLVAVFTDVIVVRLGGNAISTSLPGAVAMAWHDGQHLVAVATAVTAIVAPALFILLRLYVMVPLAVGRLAPGFGACVRALHRVARWNMVEVLTIGGLLSLVRLAALAQATPGPALFALGVLTLLFAAIETAGLRHLWRYAG